MKLRNRLALGGEAFVSQIWDMCSPDGDHEGLKDVRRKGSWQDVVQAVEQEKGLSWAVFSGFAETGGKRLSEDARLRRNVRKIEEMLNIPT